MTNKGNEHKVQARIDARDAIKNHALHVPKRWYNDYIINREYEQYFHMWLNYYLKEGVE